MLELEEELTRTLAPPLPFLLAQAVSEVITSTDIPRLTKFQCLLRNPAFASKFVSYLTSHHINAVQTVCRESTLAGYISMLKICSSSGSQSVIDDFFDLINDSIMWPEFAFKLANAIDTRAEISYQLITELDDKSAKDILHAILQCHTEFHNQFGLPEDEDAFRQNPKFAEFFTELIRANCDLFVDLVNTVATRPSNKHLMSNIVEMNNQNMFNTKLIEKMAKTDRGCTALMHFFHLADRPETELTDLLSDKELLRTERGRLLFQLWNYENDSAVTVAENAIEVLQEAIEPDLKKVSKKICDIADAIIQIFSDLTNIKRSLKIMQKQQSNKVPRVSAGRIDDDEEHENTLSFAESIQSVVVGDLMDVDQQSLRQEDYCCVPINHSYHFPTVTETSDESAESASCDVVMGEFSNQTLNCVDQLIITFFFVKISGSSKITLFQCYTFLIPVSDE